MLRFFCASRLALADLPSMRHPNVVTELRKTYLFSFFWMFLILNPVAIPYFQSLGISMEQFFQLCALYGVVFAVFEIPTGYICDMWGRKRVLVIGSFLTACAFTCLLVVKSFWTLVAYEIALAIGSSLVSGADISFLYDALEDNGKHQSHGSHALANLQLAQVSGESIASILGGILVLWSFKHVIVGHVIASWLPVAVALTIKESRQFTRKHTGHIENIFGVMKQVFGGDHVIASIVLAYR